MLAERITHLGITPEEAKLLGLQDMDREACKRVLGNLPRYAEGIYIPYFDQHGRKLPTYRFRVENPEQTTMDRVAGKRAPKYLQPKGTPPEIYLPKLIDWQNIKAKPTEAIVITEGEFKSISCTKNFGPCVGLGGVWSFRTTRLGQDLLPSLEEFAWEGRLVYIVYDSDAARNPNIAQAEESLARTLTLRGAKPYIVRLPDVPGMTKTGIDDYLHVMGADRLAAILDDAPPFSESSELHRLNGEVVYVEDPGIIIRLDTGQKLQPSSFTAHAFAHRRYTEKVLDKKGNSRLVEKSAATEWLKWRSRTTVRSITYAPGQPQITDGGQFNTWKGWGCSPVEGDVKPFLDLVDYVFTDADKGSKEWFLKWLAYPIQNPGTKLLQSVLLWSRATGTGKTFIGYAMGKIYGSNFVEIGNKELAGSFNEWMLDTQFVLGDEICGSDARGESDRMKSLITQQQARINVKYLPSYSVPDCCNYYFTSNHPTAFFLDDTDRRYFIHEITVGPNSPEFYKVCDKWLHGSGPSHLFHYLLNLDLTGFEPNGRAPMTQAKANMVVLGRSELDDWVAKLQDSPETLLRLPGDHTHKALWTSEDLRMVFDPQNCKRVTDQTMARALAKAGVARACRGNTVPTEEGYKRFWILRDAEKYLLLNKVEVLNLYAAERGKPSKRSKF